MHDILQYQVYYFLGIGGIGMSALARYFKRHNKIIIGYDKTKTLLTEQLTNEGMECYYEENITALQKRIKDYLKENILVIYTPAIPEDNPELKYFRDNNFIIKKRSEVLGEIVNKYHCIAVAGTHGKTTTTSLITHIFYQAQRNVLAFVGGVMTNYDTNFLFNIPHPSDTLYSITEADEYDRSFLQLRPQAAVITSVDADHLDIYQTHENLISAYQQFSHNIHSNGLLVVNNSVDNFFENIKTKTTFDVNLNGQISASHLRFQDNKMLFNLHIENSVFNDIELGTPGQHNVLNALAAIGIARHYNIPFENIFSALKTFKGVKRRFEYHIKKENLVLIDDYAHHPEEIKAFIQSVKALYPDKKITAIFQPHLYSRTRDFLQEFAEALTIADEIILLDIYPAREHPIKNISSQTLLNIIPNTNKKLLPKKDIANYLKNSQHEVILTIGAGDIDLLIPEIKTQLLQQCK